MRFLALLSAIVVLLVCASCADSPTDSLLEDDQAVGHSNISSAVVFPSAANLAHFEAFAKSDKSKGAVRWIPDDFCAVLDAEGHGHIVPCVNQIATYSRNGNALVHTSASGIPNETGTVVRWDYHNPGPDLMAYFGGPPSPCFLLGPEGEMLFTSNWHGIVTPSGSASFICHYSEKWAVPNPWE
jgi:hypothetical protein